MTPSDGPSATDALLDATRGDSAKDSSPMDAATDGARDASTDVAGEDALDAPAEEGGVVDAEDDGGTDALTDVAPDVTIVATPDAGEDGGLPATAVAIWDFDDPVGSTTTVDATGNGHTATLEGTAAIVSGGKSGNALSIDGTVGAFADVTGGPLFDDSQPFSVSVWVKFPGFDGADDVLLGADGVNVSTFALQLSPVVSTGYDAEFAFPTSDIGTPGTYVYAYSSGAPGTVTWYHLAGVYDGTTVRCYMNGVVQSNPKSSPTGSTAPVKAVGDFIMGAGKYDGMRTHGPQALYDGVRIYAGALNAAQVMTLYGLPQ